MAYLPSLKLMTRTGRIGGAVGNAQLERGRGNPIDLSAKTREMRIKLNAAVASSTPDSWVKVSGTLGRSGDGRFVTFWVNDFSPTAKK